MKFEPTKESIQSHEVPQWYKDAKFGIFIHWGLFSIPGWAPGMEAGESIANMSGMDLGHQMKYHPYAEWYLNSSRIEGSPTQEYHQKTYGKDFNYFDFYKEFQKESDKMDPQAWASFFEQAGAKYVVLVTKHHDGYTLWPSRHKNPMMPDYQSRRDLVGELTDAVRAHNMKMGLYYSGIFDWTFKKQPMDSIENWVDHYVASDEYARYSEAQTRELIERYHPSILWNDMGYPAQADLPSLFADYLNTVEDGVIDNRWMQVSEKDRQAYSAEIRQALAEGKGIPAPSEYGDYVTPEYAKELTYSPQKWELCRGIGVSFGYNKNENPANFMTAKDIIWCLIDVTSKNGNLLLNVGPMPDGTIQPEQMRPLLETGAWLQQNGEAIYGTTCRPDKQTDRTTDGKEVRYTCKGDTLYAIVMDENPGQTVSIPGLSVPEGKTVKLLGTENSPVSLPFEQKKEDGGTLTVHLPQGIRPPAYVLKI